MVPLRMIDEPELLEHLIKSASPMAGNRLSLTDARDCVANPRLQGFYVRNLDNTDLPPAGISALSDISMLAPMVLPWKNRNF